MQWFAKLSTIRAQYTSLQRRLAKVAYLDDPAEHAHTHVMDKSRPMPSSSQGSGFGMPRGVATDRHGREFYTAGTAGERADRLYVDALPEGPHERQKAIDAFDRRAEQQQSEARAERQRRWQAWRATQSPNDPYANDQLQDAHTNAHNRFWGRPISERWGGQQPTVGPQATVGARQPPRDATVQDSNPWSRVNFYNLTDRASDPVNNSQNSGGWLTPDLGQSFTGPSNSVKQALAAADYDNRSGVWRNVGQNSPGQGNDAVHQTRQSAATHATGNGLLRQSQVPAAKLGAAVRQRLISDPRLDGLQYQ